METMTLFATCKPFIGEFGRIQRNALRSWTSVRPACDIIVFGDEPGVADACKDFRIRHVRDIPRNQHGTPRLDGLFAAAEQHATTELLGLVNADIMLTGDFPAAVAQCRARFERFLLIVRRWNVELGESWDFSAPEWESRLRTFARIQGHLEPVTGGMDCFVYPRGMWPALPPFAIGRGTWDNALIYLARQRRVPVVDATAAVTCVHQNHGYAQGFKTPSGIFQGQEADENLRLCDGEDVSRFNAVHATHVVTPSGIHRRMEINPVHLYRRLSVLPLLYKPLWFLASPVRYCTRIARALRALGKKLVAV